MNDGLFGMIIGYLLGAFSAVLAISIYHGLWFEPMDDEEEYEDVY